MDRSKRDATDALLFSLSHSVTLWKIISEPIGKGIFLLTGAFIIPFLPHEQHPHPSLLLIFSFPSSFLADFHSFRLGLLLGSFSTCVGLFMNCPVSFVTRRTLVLIDSFTQSLNSKLLFLSSDRASLSSSLSLSHPSVLLPDSSEILSAVSCCCCCLY